MLFIDIVIFTCDELLFWAKAKLKIPIVKARVNQNDVTYFLNEILCDIALQKCKPKISFHLSFGK